ncbi:N-acetylmuramoyl-L-alanine amidase [Desulfobacula sp.]|uniref:N-acetylmuramoyl-L-alanine amidase family protein n=1 Tax=Desulfobacula sp. TaxID=2593537 RepID=UPI002616D7AD|nr:N-acetylmuramoyl-L-alanine amidase [Desulfobacula sp.]
MPKEIVSAFVILLSLLILPNMGVGYQTIQTTQQMIVIDPGHGGTDTGLISSSGLKEKNIALKLARKTGKLLEKRYNVLLTRNNDLHIPARERIFLANKNTADLFLSIHLHRSNQPFVFCYYFDPPAPYPKLATANDSTWKSHPLLHQPGSKQVINSFFSIFSTHKKTHQFLSTGSPILLLEGLTMPAILIEPFCISTLPQPPDEIDIILDEYAVLISKSIDHYFMGE